MLSIGTSAGAGYYIEQQATYYLGGTEPNGHWWNQPGNFGYKDGADVDPEAFKTLHGGFSPRDGRALTMNAGADNRRGGYDLTFSADKSISAVWAVAPVAMKVEIEAAQEVAVRAALDLMRERAGWTRRGKGGETREQVQMFGALFRHGDTRAGDPELHTHSVILNVAQRSDGTWGSVANEDLFRWKLAAGAVYRTELAHQLRQRLGLDIEKYGERDEFIRIPGVPENLCESWSKRRATIKAKAAKEGLVTGQNQRRAAALALATRSGKNLEGQEGREDRWRDEAASLGFTSDHAVALAGQQMPMDPVVERNRAWKAVTDNVRAIVAHDSVFTEQKLWQVTAEAAAGFFPAKDIAGLMNRLEAEKVVIRLPSADRQVVFSTSDAIENEVAVRALTRAAQAMNAIRCTEEHAAAAIAASDTVLSSEQGGGARHLMVAPGGVVTLEGAPGVGKSTLLKPVVAGYREAGAEQIIAVAVAWRQARELGSGIGADVSLATDVLLQQWQRRQIQITNRTVIVSDELGQLSASQARALLEMRAATGCRLIGVGDRRQLQPVGAGPGMRLMTQEAAPVTVDTIIRQDDPAARAAIRATMTGDAASAIQAHRQRGYVTEAPDYAAAVNVAAKLYHEACAKVDASKVAVIANSWADVRAISSAIRAHLRTNGGLSGEDVMFKVAGNSPGRTVKLALAVGDEVRFRMRNDALGVVNGTVGRVVDIEAERQRLTVELVGGRRVTVDPKTYKDASGLMPLAHSYASTLAAAQGITVQIPITLASAMYTREAATVALSRGTEWATIVLDRGALEEEIRARRSDAEARNSVTTEEVDAHLARAWSREGQKVSALDYLDANEVEAWIRGWQGHQPVETFTGYGAPVAEVVQIVSAREHRQGEALSVGSEISSWEELVPAAAQERQWVQEQAARMLPTLRQGGVVHVSGRFVMAKAEAERQIEAEKAAQIIASERESRPLEKLETLSEHPEGMAWTAGQEQQWVREQATHILSILQQGGSVHASGRFETAKAEATPQIEDDDMSEPEMEM